VTTFIAVVVAAVVTGDGRSNWFSWLYALVALRAYVVGV